MINPFMRSPSRIILLYKFRRRKIFIMEESSTSILRSFFSSHSLNKENKSGKHLSNIPKHKRKRYRPEFDGGPIKEDLVASLPGQWDDVREDIRKQANILGFTRARITTIEPSSRIEQYKKWIEEGLHGEMSYLGREDRIARREDLNLILPGVQSVICTLTLYWPGRKAFPEHSLPPNMQQQKRSAAAADKTKEDSAAAGGGRRGIISCYSWGEDYHDIITPRLEQLANYIHGKYGGRGRWYVDTGPIMERDLAQRAGLGFIGKNTLLINEQVGSGTFLAELLSTLPLPPDEKRKKSGGCGRCQRCIVACPTQAIDQAGYTLDARRCVSYLTIENKSSIPLELRPLIGQLIYGCDICQQVCPWNRWSWPSNEPKTPFGIPSLDISNPLLHELIQLQDEESFNQRYAHSPIKRIGRKRLLRNVAVAIGNSGDADYFIPVLQEVKDRETEALILEHVEWAIEQLQREKFGKEEQPEEEEEEEVS